MAEQITEYRLSDTVLNRARGLELPRRQWRVLFAFREDSPQDIINDLEIDEETLRLTLVNLENFGLLERKAQQADGAASATTNGAQPSPQARRAPAAKPQPQPAEPAEAKPPKPEAPQAQPAQPKPQPPQPAPPEPAREPAQAKSKTGAEADAKAEAEPAAKKTEAKPQPVASPRPTEPPKPAPAARKAARGVLLKPVIDFIQDSAGSGTLGQLTVYRVFLKIPPHLLKEARIQSVKFVDENFRIENVELQKAIRSAVKRTLNKDVPEKLLPC